MSQQESKYKRAKERVAALRDFYVHLVVYVLVNLLLFAIDITASPDVLWFFWPLLGWGIAVVLHALSVFGSGFPFGEAWEKKKIEEIMEE